MRTKALKSSKTDEEQNNNPLRVLCDFGVEQPKKAAPFVGLRLEGGVETAAG
jgi:hypothetical protein